MRRFEFKEGSKTQQAVFLLLVRFAFAICRDLPRAISTHAPQSRLFGL